MKDSQEYAALLQSMRTGTNDDLLADLTRFIDSFADHDDDCPGYSAVGRDAELSTCTCGFARRHDLLAELMLRLGRV